MDRDRDKHPKDRDWDLPADLTELGWNPPTERKKPPPPPPDDD
jgi:hypothetical protein